MAEAVLVIQPGREKPILQRHPWVFSRAVAAVHGSPEPGDLVTVTTQDGAFLARGYWNPHSQIRVRLLTWQDEPVDESWWRRMLAQAAAARAHLLQDRTGGFRVVNAENDFLPGLVVDRYGDFLVMQALTMGIDRRKNQLADILAGLLQPAGIYERSDVDIRSKEGLKLETGVLWGQLPPEQIVVAEDGLRFQVDIRRGHKTGFYLDQRENRRLVRELAVRHQAVRDGDLSLLNLFSYTGGFGLHALAAGAARVINVDSSREALELAEQNVGLNYPGRADRCEFIQANVFRYLRDQVSEGQQYDMVVLDPPKFAQSASQVEKALSGYKDINWNAFRLVKPGGWLLTFSCSGAVSPDLFQKVVFGALADSGRQAQVVRHLGPGDDHPVALTFPEGAYLKGLLLRVL